MKILTYPSNHIVVIAILLCAHRPHHVVIGWNLRVVSSSHIAAHVVALIHHWVVVTHADVALHILLSHGAGVHRTIRTSHWSLRRKVSGILTRKNRYLSVELLCL